MRCCHLLLLLAALSTAAETRFVRTVTWQWARDYLDQDIYVTGKVVAGYDLGDRCFLRFDNANKHSFVVIITGEQLKQQPFAVPIHAMYVDQPVRVRGIIRENKARNRAEMHIEDLSKIEYGDDVLAQPLPLPDEIPDPEPEPEVVEETVPIPDEPEPRPTTRQPMIETPAGIPSLDPGPTLLTPVVEPVEAPAPPVEPKAPEPEPEQAEAPVPAPEPVPVEVQAKAPAPALDPVPVEVQAAADRWVSWRGRKRGPALDPEPALAPEVIAEVQIDLPVVDAPDIDDSVAAITLDDAVLDLAPPKPKKPKFRKLALSEMDVQVLASSTSKAFPGEEEAEVIVDGISKGSFWSSESSDAQEITLDLKAQFLLRNVGLYWESPAAKYNVRTSQDGVIWTTVSEEESLDKGPRADRVKFLATQARFLRIQMQERVVHTRGYSLFEIEILGSPLP